MTDKLQPTEQDRHTFSHNGQKVYQWDQTLEEVNVYVDAPPGLAAKFLFCDIECQKVKFGIKGNPPFLDKPLERKCIKEDSFWTLEDGELHMTLTKMEKGAMWPAAFQGQTTDAMSADKDQKRLLLERFQQEHAGFDFSGAEVSGSCPDPRTFMEGVKYA
mmetsp:Transcript_2895/g.4876  ORF Transcript_2895/g.4876 Transcript_2895/m.4876 type:complete len:160 (+) Transcript_2895:134-613(+)|eukprot:CAMPEP_0198211376 /NCGR_PEP_ID=MMETSP1445-20131203/23461_1 /TAXON_ID=36898 /ORGANISM="Pyramimonas sp., Strain CCMP2087" /LENGTH=159 /DNA_ID=CAMNT_0043885621 /DNA_START=126 /DNA_END=605 /DNA_ORIENTATION=+